LESIRSPPRALRVLPTRRWSPRTGLTLRSGRRQRRNRVASHPRRPCHKRAIHSSPERSPADSHGQHQGGLDLRRFPSLQVITAPDLALGAGGRLVEACIGLAVPGRPIRSLVAEDRSAEGVRDQTGPAPTGAARDLGHRDNHGHRRTMNTRSARLPTRSSTRRNSLQGPGHRRLRDGPANESSLLP
jgi:hypothetical protein